MKKFTILLIALAACTPLGLAGPAEKIVSLPTDTVFPTQSVQAPYPTYTSYPTYTAVLETLASTGVSSQTAGESQLTNTAIPTNTPPFGATPFPTQIHIQTSLASATATYTVFPTNTLVATFTLTQEVSVSPGNSIFVKVTADKTVLRQISSYNDAGYPIMVIREPRLRYSQGEVLQVYASGGEEGGPLYRSNGSDYYYRIFDPDGIEEELYVPAWHVSKTAAPTATPEGTLSPEPTEAQSTIFVKVTAWKTVLRIIGSYNKKGVPIMEVREPRIRYESGEIIQVYANGGENDGPTYRTDGADYYYRVYDSDGNEEELYVPAWHVEVVNIK